MIPTQKQCDPNFFLDDGNYCKGQAIRCIVASDANTHNPPVVYIRTGDTEKKITVAEAERLMLWPAGVTDGWCAKVEMNHDRALRMKMIGNAISGQRLRNLLTGTAPITNPP